MTRLPQVSSRDMIKFLKDKGWVYDHTSGSHHILKNTNGRFASIPQRDPIGKGLLLNILAEVQITREEFIKEWHG